jgi:hypothetical protein
MVRGLLIDNYQTSILKVPGLLNCLKQGVLLLETVLDKGYGLIQRLHKLFYTIFKYILELNKFKPLLRQRAFLMPKKTIRNNRKSLQSSAIITEKISPHKKCSSKNSPFYYHSTTTTGKIVPFFAKLCPFLREQVKPANPH